MPRRSRPRRRPRRFRSSSRSAATRSKLGLVASLNRPGGNVTGRDLVRQTSWMAKRLELLRELVPERDSIGVLVNPNSPDCRASSCRDVQAAARAIGQKFLCRRMPATTPSSMRPSRRSRNSGRMRSLFAPDVFFDTRRDATRRAGGAPALPAIYHREYADVGGLMSYGRDHRCISPGRHLHRPNPQGREARRSAGRAADQVRVGDQPQDRQGARPRVPPTLLARADEVIE